MLNRLKGLFFAIIAIVVVFAGYLVILRQMNLTDSNKEFVDRTRFPLKVRALKPADFKKVSHLLEPVSKFYPNFHLWLKARLAAYRNKGTSVVVVESYGEVVGTAIGILKRGSRYKISTLYVNPVYSNIGIGTVLLNKMIDAAHEARANSIYITADSSLDETVGSLLRNNGFELVASEAGKYDSQRVENVYLRSI